MADLNETHPFLVSVWSPGNISTFEKGYWKEYARCQSISSANEVAESLAIRHPEGIQIANLVMDEYGTRWNSYRYIPDEAWELMKKEMM